MLVFKVILAGSPFGFISFILKSVPYLSTFPHFIMSLISVNRYSSQTAGYLGGEKGWSLCPLRLSACFHTNGRAGNVDKSCRRGDLRGAILLKVWEAALFFSA